MCQYYAHAYICKHTTLSFAQFCGPANLIQTPCKKRRIWQTIRMDEPCEECRVSFPDSSFAAIAQARRA